MGDEATWGIAGPADLANLVGVRAGRSDSGSDRIPWATWVPTGLPSRALRFWVRSNPMGPVGALWVSELGSPMLGPIESHGYPWVPRVSETDDGGRTFRTLASTGLCLLL